MPTDGANYPKRVKLYGRVYRIATDGAPVCEVAAMGAAGIARDLCSNPIPWLKAAIQACQEHDKGLFRTDPLTLLTVLNGVCDSMDNQNQVIAKQALPGIVGRLIEAGQSLSEEKICEGLAKGFVENKLIEADLGDCCANGQKDTGLTIRQANAELRATAVPATKGVFKSAAQKDSGRPHASFKTAGPSLAVIDSTSLESLSQPFPETF